MNKKKIKITVFGILFVWLCGTLLHFLYDYFPSPITSLFAPVNESSWEHIKLLYFPMLLYAALISCRKTFLSLSLFPAFCGGLLAGSFSIPVLFYAYTGMIGRNYIVMDIAVFFISVVIGFLVSYLLYEQKSILKYRHYLYLSTGILTALFFLFTFYPPVIALFISPVQ